MDFCQKLLGSNLDELTYESIEQYFLKAQKETNLIEYKSYAPNEPLDKQYPKILKSICAFLNSEGGILIWGAPRGKQEPGKKEKVFVGDLFPLNVSLEQDQIVTKISQSITPIPKGLRIQILEEEKKILVIVEVQKSEYPPHQAMNSYFMRLDGQSVHAPHHYIEALFKQIRYPQLQGFIKFLSLDKQRNKQLLTIEVVIVNMTPYLNERKVSFVLESKKGFFSKFHSTDKKGEVSPTKHQLSCDNLIEILHFGRLATYKVRAAFNHKSDGKLVEKCGLRIFFGGKTSPLKFSEYDLDLSNFNDANINSIVTNRNENKDSFEYARANGLDNGSVDEMLER